MHILCTLQDFDLLLLSFLHWRYLLYKIALYFWTIDSDAVIELCGLDQIKGLFDLEGTGL